MEVETKEVQTVGGQDVPVSAAAADVLMKPRAKSRHVYVREVQEHLERDQESDPSWMMLPTPISPE
eukprot:12904591-Prorocentrum_lima.AAC.1